MDDPNDELSAPSDVTRGETPGVRANLTHQKPGQATTASALDRVFIGPNGIRAGWRILLFLSIAVIVGLLLGQAIRALGIRAGAGFNPLTAVLGEGIGLAAGLFFNA